MRATTWWWWIIFRAGHREAVDPARLRVVDLLDTEGLVRVMNEKPCDAVIHFAAFIAVGESMKVPELYFRNNMAGSLSLLTAMVKAGIEKIVFSSTAAVYGMPAHVPIPEVGAQRAGECVWRIEGDGGDAARMVRPDPRHAERLPALFQRVGRRSEGTRGEDHEPETHLIPLLFRAVQTGKPVTLFGDDYATPDGTCIRDYIHVTDLAQAHIAAVESLCAGGESKKYNVGTGHGYSVKEVLQAVEKVTGKKVPFAWGRGATAIRRCWWRIRRGCSGNSGGSRTIRT